MVEIYGKYYYIDIDAITERCAIIDIIKKENEDVEYEDSGSLNVFKFEIIKMCVEKILGDFEEEDEGLGVFGVTKSSPSFKIAFNTLLKYQIIKEEDE